MRLGPEFLSLETYEDAEQACAVSHPPVLLYYDPQTERVLRGEYAGEDIDLAYINLLLTAIVGDCDCQKEHLIGRPWWRWFRLTPAMLVTFSPLLGAR